MVKLDTTMNRRQFLTFTSLGLGMSLKVHANKGSRTGLVLDERFAEHVINAAHPESPARFKAIETQLHAEPFFDGLHLIQPKQDIESALSLVHSTQHIETIKQNQARTHELAMLATGGILAGVDAVCSGQLQNVFCASRPPGHHALNTGQEEGFCYYNHIAIAARYAQQHYQVGKVLIIDWDYHHGNGTEWAFYSDPSVLFFSTHDMYAYPRTGLMTRTGEGKGKGFNINVHLDCGADDKTILSAFEQYLLPAVQNFKPELILVSAGFDSRRDDLLGCHHISDDGFAALTRLVKQLADQYCDGKLVSLLEGGYNIEGNAQAVVAHLNALR
jgi:acetoin utilization deacetylase AcuC-like enzyme